MKLYYFFLLSFLASYVTAFRTRGLKAPFLPANTPLPKPQYIDQRLDHLGPTSSSTWKQRYFVNSSWWNPSSGPVFILLGGEGPADPAWIVADTNIMLLAMKYSALVFSVEHRFYGESHPTNDTSIDSLRYLSSRQSLADFAYFHDLMVTKYNMTEKNKWISFGGSYSGALSAWFRQLYPKVVVGAVASSAPVLAKLDFVEYVEVVEASLATAAASCPSLVALASASLSAMLEDKRQWKEVEKIFNVKPSISSGLDAIQLIENLAGNFEEIVQYNRDNTAFEGRPNNVTIDDLCAIMTNKSIDKPLYRYAEINRQMTGNSTLDCNYTAQIEFLNESSWDSSAVAGGDRQWTYQTCTEFGYFQTTDSTQSSLFSHQISLDYYLDMCTQVFGISPVNVKLAVDATNSFYGGRNVTGTNIIFPNGSIDPWHALSITQDISDAVRALFIQGTAHCANMYPPRDSDPQELTQARFTISLMIENWLKE